jgi:hypothetical protein
MEITHASVIAAASMANDPAAAAAVAAAGSLMQASTAAAAATAQPAAAAAHSAPAAAASSSEAPREKKKKENKYRRGEQSRRLHASLDTARSQAHSPAVVARLSGTTVDAALVAYCRQGHTRLIHLGDFAKKHAELRGRLARTCAALEREPQPDLSVGDIALSTPFEAIERAIDAEVERVEEFRDAQSKAQRLINQQAKRGYSLMLEEQRMRETEEAYAAAQLQDPPVQPMDAGVPMDIEDGSDRVQAKQEAGQAAAAASSMMQDEENNPESAAIAHPDAAGAAAASSYSAAASSSIAEPAASSSSAAPMEESKEQPPFDASAAAAAAFGNYYDETETDAETLKKLNLPPDFGVKIPDFDMLNEPLHELQRHSARSSKRSRHAETNCMTTKTFEYDIKSRTAQMEPVPLPPNEVLLHIAVYHPTNYTKTQEFIVAGSSPLTALRDRIYCLHDHLLDGNQTPSGFFFIEGTFYDDLRDHRAIRYSQPIREWVKKEGRYKQQGLAVWEESEMEKVEWKELSVRLGAHYLYQHQGNCQHTFLITQVRMAHSGDEQNKLAYPLKPFQAKTRRRKCRVCDLYPAAYVTYGDKLANENPFFFCEECYRPLHYSFQGNLLYNDFQVYSYDHE